MKTIANIAVVGAGAIGASYASNFHDGGIPTSLVAKGERLKRMKENGIVINNKHYFLPIINPEDAIRPFDLIFVAVKNHHLPAAIDDMQNLIDQETIIISALNGLDSEAFIGEVFGMEHLLYATVIGRDAVRDGNRINYSAPGKLHFGENDNTKLSDRVQALIDVFEFANIPYEIPVDMQRTMWWKFMVNVGMNQASAVMRAPYGVFQESTEAQGIMESLMNEVIELAKAEEVNLRENDINDWYAVLKTLSPGGKTSMLQDIEAKRKTEVEIFAGKVVALGEKHDIPTPVNQAILRIIHVLENH